MDLLLFVYSCFSRLGSGLKNFLYNKKILRPAEASLPVISTGNISLGGTGKTPLAMNLLKFFLSLEIKPALISRGYKGTWENSGGILSDGEKIKGTWEESGDEPYMIARNFPKAGVFIGKNRLASCRTAQNLGFKVAVLDDGFQHRKLHRNLDILLYDPSERTDLRECSSAKKRAHIFLLEEKHSQEISRLPKGSVGFVYTQTAIGFFDLKDKPVKNLPNKTIAFCGIAHPGRFKSTLNQGNVFPAAFLFFPDHFSYPASSLKKILAKCRKNEAGAALTTEKDAVKLRGRLTDWDIPVYYLKIELKIDEGFYQKVTGLFPGRK
ncbi:MAG: tetraacyldisaccharide 4'-kinase [Candidatus Aminicenantes bacterium]|nr:tetraacyldisaccharide 4'-kinase [Candidatus Aminicenantes bacterium]